MNNIPLSKKIENLPLFAKKKGMVFCTASTKDLVKDVT